MSKTIDEIRGEMDALHEAGTYKTEPVLAGPMGPTVQLAGGAEVVNL